MRSIGKETKLTEKTTITTEDDIKQASGEMPIRLDSVVQPADTVEHYASANARARRARRTRRDGNGLENDPAGQAGSDLADAGEKIGSNGHAESEHSLRQVARNERRGRPRAPRAEKSADPLNSASAGIDKLADGSPPASDASAAAAEALVINLSGKKPNRGARTAKRARRKQEDAAAALSGADNNPALGALNRHLNMMMQQLGTAHRVIGRIAAERDALRQQLADLQGIPVDEIVVTSLGAAADQPASTPKPTEPQPKTGISRLNYFGGEDVVVMRRRRQTFVLGLLVFMVMLWLAARMGAWQVPANLSRDSLTALPYVGDFMSLFLAGWLLFRFVRVTSKGVKWVFPSDDPRRRRR
jgi:hypothetical protein